MAETHPPFTEGLTVQEEPVEVKQSPVREELGLIANAIDALGSEVQKLLERLKPVCCKPQPIGKEETNKSSPSCSLTNDLRVHRNKIDEIGQMVNVLNLTLQL